MDGLERTDRGKTELPVPKAGTAGGAGGTGAGAGTGAGNGNRALEAARSRAPRPADRGTGAAGAGADKREIKSKETSGLPPVKPKDVVISEANEVEVPKQRKKRTPKNKTPEAVNTSQLTTLIITVSEVAASRAGDHWKLTKAEAESIADPAAKLINNNETLKKITEHSDALALVAACLIVFTPRVMVTAQNNKQKRVKANAGTRRTNNGEALKLGTVRNEVKQSNPDDVKTPVPDGGKLSTEIDIFS